MDDENRGSHESENRINGLYAYTIDGKECTREEYEAALAALDKLQETYNEKLYQVQVIPSMRRDTAPHYKQGKIPNTERIFFFKPQGVHDAKDIDLYDLNTLQDNQWFLCVADKVNTVPGNLNKGSVEGVPLQRAPVLREWIAKDDATLRIGNIYAPRVTYVERNGKYRNDTGKPIDFFTDPRLIDQIGIPPSLRQKVASDLEAYNHALTRALAAIQWPSQKGDTPYNDGTLRGIVTTTFENSYGSFRKVSVFQCPQVPNGVIKHEELLFYSGELSKPDSLEKIKQVFTLLGRPDKVTAALDSSQPSINCSWGEMTETCSIDAIMADPSFTANIQEASEENEGDNSRIYRYTLVINSNATGSLELEDILYRETLHPYAPAVIKAHVGTAAYKLAGDQIEQQLKSQIRRQPLEEYELKFRERSIEHHEQIDSNVSRKPYEHDFIKAIHAIEPILNNPPRYDVWKIVEFDEDRESADGMRGGGFATKRTVRVSGYVFGEFRIEWSFISDNPAEVKRTILSSLLADIAFYIKQLDEDASTRLSYTTPFGNHAITPEDWYIGPEPELPNKDEYQERKREIDARFAAIQGKWRTIYLPAAKYVEDMASEDTKTLIENKEALLVTIQHITEKLPNLKKSPIGIYSSVDIDNLLQELKNKMQPFIDDRPAFLSVAEGLLIELQTFKDSVDKMRSLCGIVDKCNKMFTERQKSPPFILQFQKIFSQYSSDPIKDALSADLKPDETIEDRITHLAKQTRDKLSSALNLIFAPESDINLIETMGDYLKGIETSQKLVDEWIKILLDESQDPMLGIPGNTFDGTNIVFHAEHMHDPYNVRGTRNDGTQNYVLLGESVAINTDTGAEFPFAPVQFIMNAGSRYYHDIIIALDLYHSPVNTLPDRVTYRSENVIKGTSYPLLTGNTTEVKVADDENEILRKAREAKSIFEGNVSVNEKKQDKRLQPISRQSPQDQLLDDQELKELGIHRKPLPNKEITFRTLTAEHAAHLLDTPLDELPQFLDGSIQHLHFQNARQFTEKTFEEVALSRIDSTTISDTLASLDSMKQEISGSESTPQKEQVIDRLAALQTEYKRRWTAIQAPGNFSQELKSAGFDIKDTEVKKIIAIASYHQLNSGVDSLKTVLQEIIRATINTLLLNKVVQYALENELVEAEDVDRMKRSITDIIASDPKWNINDIDHIGLIALYALDKM